MVSPENLRGIQMVLRKFSALDQTLTDDDGFPVGKKAAFSIMRSVKTSCKRKNCLFLTSDLGQGDSSVSLPVEDFQSLI